MPGYLKANYITEKRKNENCQAKSPNPKKRNWVPSSHYAAPPMNKIPKDTIKAIEMRLINEQKPNVTLDSTIPSAPFQDNKEA